jgi:hypothetical protein
MIMDKKKIDEKKLKLAEEISYLYKELDSPIDRSSEGLLNRIDFLCQWMSRSAQIVAECEIMYDWKKGEIAETHINTDQSWNIVKQQIEAGAGEEKRLYRLAERLNVAITHSLDAVRTLVSYEKQELINQQNIGSINVKHRDA